MRLLAHCKVNLCLEVLGRRGDGYHDLATVFQTVSPADEFNVEVGGTDIQVIVTAGEAPAGPENLCWRAAESYRQLRGWPVGVRIELTKRVPSAAGLGGGSSDAAATLNALAALDAQPLEPDDIRRLAAALGSDVAFFIEGGTALGTGRGERLEQLPALDSVSIVLAKPELAIPTAEAYGMLRAGDFTDGTRAQAMAQVIRRGGSVAEIAGYVHNAFTAALTHRWPVLRETLDAIKRAGAVAAQVSGSGAACFGLFESCEQAEQAAESLRRAGLWAQAAWTVAYGCEIVC